MTQTNTTQNKEELSKEVEERFEKQDFCFTDLDGNRKLHTNDDFTDEVKQFLAQELSQAHQSGIEEEREKCLLRLEACLFGTYDVKNLDVEPPTLEKATIKTIQDHIQMHINLIKKEL